MVRWRGPGGDGNDQDEETESTTNQRDSTTDETDDAVDGSGSSTTSSTSTDTRDRRDPTFDRPEEPADDTGGAATPVERATDDSRQRDRDGGADTRDRNQPQVESGGEETPDTTDRPETTQNATDDQPPQTTDGQPRQGPTGDDRYAPSRDPGDDANMEQRQGVEYADLEGKYVVGGEIVSKAEAKAAAIKRAVSNSELSRSDITATLTGGTIVYRLTQSGAERFKGSPGTQVGEGSISTAEETVDRLEGRAIDETAAERPADVRVTRDQGQLGIEYTGSGREEAVADQLGVDATDIDLRGDRVVGTTEQGQAAVTMQAIAQQVREEYPDRRSMSISQTDSGAWRVEVTTGEGETVTRTVRPDRQPEQQSPAEAFADAGPLGPGSQPDAEQAAAVKAEAALEEELGVDLEPGDYEVTYTETEQGTEMQVSLTESGRRKVRTSPEAEEYGNVELTIPGTGGESVEDYLHWASEEYTDLLEDATGPGGIFGESAVAEAFEAAGYEGTAEDIEGVGRDFLGGAGQMGNVPAMALGIKEAGETLGYLTGEYAAGRGDEAYSQLEGDIQNLMDAVEQQVREDTAGTAGMVAGSLIGSTAIMSGAARVSSRAGLATRLAIQPGEEALTIGGTKALSRSARGQRVLDAIPGGKLDWEEPVIYAGAKGLSKTRDVVGTRGRYAASAVTSEAGEVAMDIRREMRALRYPRPEGPETGPIELEFGRSGEGPADAYVVQDFRPETETGTEEDRDQGDIGGSGGDAIVVDVRSGQQLKRMRLEQEFEEETAGTAIEMTRADTETKLRDGMGRVETETEYERTQTDLASAEQQVQDAVDRLDRAFEPGMQTGQEAAPIEAGVEETNVATEVGPAIEQEVGVGVEAAVDVEQEAETGVELGIEQEQETETEVELPQEMSWEAETDRSGRSQPQVPEEPSTAIDEDFWGWDVPFATAGEAVFGDGVPEFEEQDVSLEGGEMDGMPFEDLEEFDPDQL